MKPSQPKTNNADASQALALKARTALLKGVSEDWTAAKSKAVEAGKLELQSLNLLRSAGVKLQEAANRERLSFESFRLMQPSLPKDFTWPAAQFCFQLGSQFDKPIKTLDEATAARRILFEKLGEQSTPKRIAEQTAHDSNPWSELVDKAARFTAFFDQLAEEDPMDKWSPDKLRNFISTTKPIADKHAEAIRLQAAK